MEAAYIFGTTGNLSGALGAGWSVEDAFAWAIGAESELTLPLQGDEHAYILRLDIHPAIYPPKVPRQRVMIRAGKTVIGSYEMTARDTLAVPLPVELTAGAATLHLTIIHPDAARPRDHLPVDDSRRLALCFHSASLTRTDPDVPSGRSDGAALEPVHGIIAGGTVSRRIAEVIGKLPSLKGRFGLRFVDLSLQIPEAAGTLPPQALETMQLCWMELNAGTPETRDALRQRIKPECAARGFYAPIIRSLWPFQAPDPRAVPEPGRYNPSRYPYGDRLAQPLIGMNMPDDVLYLMYSMSADQEPLELDDLFANDLRRWRAEGKKTDMQLANFIEDHIASDRLFVAPNREAPALLREMVSQILAGTVIGGIAGHATLSGELDTLLEGYAGWQEELPIHARVADHFKLAWWSPDMTWRWMNNRRTYREYILDYIRWVQWRT